MPSADHTPLGHAARYNDQCYSGMRDDADRTAAYKRAIQEAVTEDSVVVDSSCTKP